MVDLSILLVNVTEDTDDIECWYSAW